MMGAAARNEARGQTAAAVAAGAQWPCWCRLRVTSPPAWLPPVPVSVVSMVSMVPVPGPADRPADRPEPRHHTGPLFRVRIPRHSPSDGSDNKSYSFNGLKFLLNPLTFNWHIVGSGRGPALWVGHGEGREERAAKHPHPTGRAVHHRIPLLPLPLPPPLRCDSVSGHWTLGLGGID